MTNTERKVQALYDSFSTAEQKVATYFLNNTQTVFHLPIAKLAEACDVSQVVWVRFCKALGFTGLKDLKKTLFSELNEAPAQNTSVPAFADIRTYSNIQEIAANVCNSNMQALENTVQLMDLSVLEDAAKAILNASCVRLFAVGASGLVAQDFLNKLQRIGAYAFYSTDTHIQLTHAANLMSDEVAFFISNTGATKELLEMMEWAKQRGCTTITLTKYGSNPLADQADFALSTSAPEIYVRSGAMSSRIAQLTVIDILFTAIANLDYEKIEGALERSYSACATHKT